jgi:hypothetical protein
MGTRAQGTGSQVAQGHTPILIAYTPIKEHHIEAAGAARTPTPPQATSNSRQATG